MRHASLMAARCRGTLLPVLAFAAGMALSGAASAQTESVLQNLRFGGDSISYEIPRLIVRGSRLSQAELTRLADPASPEPWADRVAKLDAEEILVPEMHAVVKMPQVDQRSTYRNVSFKKVAGGRIASATAAGGTFESVQKDRKISGSYGAMSVGDIDLGVALALMDAKAGQDAPLKRIYGSFSLDGMTTTDAEGIEVKVGRMTGGEISARPTRLGWMESMKALTEAQGKTDPASKRASLEAAADVFDAFAIGAFEMNDFSVQGHSKKDDVDINVGMKRAAFVPAAAGRPGEFRVEGSHLQAGDIRFAYDSMKFVGLDGKALVGLMRELAANPDKPSPNVLRHVLPVLSSIQLDNLQMEGPADAPKGMLTGSGEKLSFKLGRFELSADKPVNGIPTDLRFSVRNLNSPVPPNSDNAGAALLGQLGYSRVDGSLGFNLGWNEAGQEIVIREISIDGKDMGSATIRGVIGKVGRDVFNLDSNVALVSLMAASAKSLDLTIDNHGLFERVIAREAARQKRQPEDVRREYGMAAAIGIPAILGNGANSKALAQAVGRFLAKPGKLTIQARAKEPGGYGFADYMANPSPAGVLEALDITATAE